jgi:NADH-quinone oxidoreductase subunit C
VTDANEQLAYIQEKLGTKVLAASRRYGDDVVLLERGELRESFRAMKEDRRLEFNLLSDLTAVDYWKKKEPRFELVYQLVSLPRRARLCVRVPVPEGEAEVESLTPLWPGANFMEREVWDLFGIRFTGHPDLRRILLYEEFKGHPLRKDYPVNLWQPLVPERQVDGTFVDDRSQNKLLRLKHALGRTK